MALPTWLSHHAKKLQGFDFGVEWQHLLNIWIGMERELGFKATSVRDLKNVFHEVI